MKSISKFSQTVSVSKSSATTAQKEGTMKTISITNPTKYDPKQATRKILGWIPVTEAPRKETTTIDGKETVKWVMSFGSFNFLAVNDEYQKMLTVSTDLPEEVLDRGYFDRVFSEYLYLLSKAATYREIMQIRSEIANIYPYINAGRKPQLPETRTSDKRDDSEEVEETELSEADELEAKALTDAEQLLNEAGAKSIFNIALGMRIKALNHLVESCRKADLWMANYYAQYMAETTDTVLLNIIEEEKSIGYKSKDKVFKYIGDAEIKEDPSLKNFRGMNAADIYYSQLCLISEDEDRDLLFAEYIRSQRKGSGKIKVDSDKAEMVADPLSATNPVEEHGILEVLCRRFSEGIQLGTTFERAWRNSQFEMGMNACDVWHPEHEVFGPEHLGNILDAKDDNYEDNLINSMEWYSEQADLRFKAAEAGYERIISHCYGLIQTVIREAGSYEAAKAKLIDYNKEGFVLGKILNAATAKVMPEAFYELTGEDLKVKYNMPYPAIKIVHFECNNAEEGLTRTDLEEIEEAMKSAKTPNQMILADLKDAAKDLITKIYSDSFDAKIALNQKVRGVVEQLLTIHGDARTASKHMGSKLNKAEVKVALELARMNNEYHFSKEEWSVLYFAGLVETAKKQISARTKELIFKLQEGIPTPDITVEDAKAILAAARSDRSKYGVDAKTFAQLNSFIRDAA